MKSPARVLAAVALALMLGGCTTVSYYAQAIGGHLQVMHQARGLDEIIADPQTPAALREKIVLARRIRQFAVEELGLPDNGSYRSYADLKRPYVLWNVFAAPEFSVVPVKSCFPIAGCVDYRGWYDEGRARSAAEDLKAAGYDVYLGGVPAYSTLGWFNDPLLNTFMAYPDFLVARLLFHELAHQVAYVRDDTEFNESFAVAVEEEGLRRWQAGGGDAERRYAVLAQRRRQFIELMLDYRRRLQDYYSLSLSLPEAERRAGKAGIFDELARSYGELKQTWEGFAGFDRFFAQGANNAMLASIASYSGKLPAFRALLKAKGGDLPAFYREVQRLAAMTRAERDAELNALVPAAK